MNHRKKRGPEHLLQDTTEQGPTSSYWKGEACIHRGVLRLGLKFLHSTTSEGVRVRRPHERRSTARSEAGESLRFTCDQCKLRYHNRDSTGGLRVVDGKAISGKYRATPSLLAGVFLDLGKPPSQSQSVYVCIHRKGGYSERLRHHHGRCLPSYDTPRNERKTITKERRSVPAEVRALSGTNHIRKVSHVPIYFSDS